MAYCMLDPPAACCLNQHNSFQGAANSEETIHKSADEQQKQLQVLQTSVSTKTRFLQLCFCSCSGTVILPTPSRRILFLHAVVTGASATCTIFRTSPVPAQRHEELETRAPISPLADPSCPCPHCYYSMGSTEKNLLQPFCHISTCFKISWTFLTVFAPFQSLAGKTLWVTLW